MVKTDRWIYGFDWNLLRTFLVIAEERSVTRAADRLLLQQPSVSAALKRLEDSLECQLFERGRRPMQLTPQGELLFGQCRDLYKAIARLDPKLSRPTSSVTGVIRIATVTQLVNGGLDAVFRSLHDKHPGISFEVQVSTSHDIIRSVSHQIVPFGFCLLVKPLTTLACRFLFRESFAIYCGARHPLFGVTEVGLGAIRSEPWVSFACAEVANSLEPMLSLRLGADLASRVVATSADLHEVRRFITAGVGIGVLPVATAARDVADGLLWPLPVAGLEDLGADVYFLANPAAEHGPAESAFLDEMGAFEPLPG